MIDISSLLSSTQGTAIDTLVSQYMAVERKPVDTLKTQRDQLSVRSSMFTDLSTKITELRDLAKSLSSSTDSAFSTHTASSSDEDAVTVSAASNASSGSYALTETRLATSQRLRSAELGATWTASTDATFSINGALISIKAGAKLADLRYAINQASYDPDRRVTASVVGSTLVLEGRTGASYGMNIADVSGSLLKDVGVIDATTHEQVLSDATTWEGDTAATSWTREIDLGTAQQVNRLVWSRDATGLNSDRTPTDYTLEYLDAASGEWKLLKTVVGGSVGADYTRQDTFAEVTTSKIRMTVTATNGGTPSSPVMDSLAVYHDTASPAAGAELQAAADGSVKVNGILVQGLSSNTGLTSVVQGLTIDLKSTGPATLTVADDTASIKTKITSFFDKLNGLVDYLKTKSQVVKDESTGDYSRGLLSGNTLYTSLQSSLASDVQRRVSGTASAAWTSLSDLGITMDSSLHFSVTDSSKLDGLLGSDPLRVAAYFGGTDGIAKRVLERLEPYVVAPKKTEGMAYDPKSYLQREQDSIQDAQDDIDDRIKTLNEQLTMKENSYREQFTRLQAMMIDAVQQQQRIQAIFAATSQYGYY